jgi:hypothetical protein
MVLPKPPRLPKLSEHLPPNPVREIVKDIRESVDSARTEVRAVADAFRIIPRNPQPFTAPRNTKTGVESTQKPVSVTKSPENVTKTGENEPGTCLPCESMRQLREAVGKRKVDKALKDLQSKGIEPESVEVLRKYIAGEDVY